MTRLYWRRSTALIAALLASAAAVGAATLAGGTLASAAPGGAAALPSCPFWTTATPPARSPGAFTAPPSLASPYSLKGRPAAPKFVSGSLNSAGQVSITFDAVPGAGSYRLWRDAIAVQWVQSSGAATYTVTDPTPCQGAFYTLVANPDGTTGTEGKLGHALQLGANGVVAPWKTPTGSTMQMLVTSYNDGGNTAAAYPTQTGMCAVDPRVIPWGTRFWVPNYGWCYAGDIGTWIQNHTVDVWLPGTEANGWGVQNRTITINKQGS